MNPQLKKRSLNWRTISIVLGAALTLVTMLIVAWILWSNALKSDYTARTNAFKTQTSQELMQKASALKDLQGSAATREALATLLDTLQQLRSKLPAEPKILGVVVIAKDMREKQTAIADRATALAEELKRSQDIMAYQEKLTPILKDVQGKTGNNLNELKALPGVWQRAIDAVKSIQPPDQTNAFHTSLLTSLESVKATLDTLPTLYEKKDTAGFVTKQKELESKVAGLKELSHVSDDIAKQQDTQLGTVSQELRKLLQ